MPTRKASILISAFCLTALFHLPLASLADNGVERGTIDFTGNTTLPAPVRAFLDSAIFQHCDLRGVALIQPNFSTFTTDYSEIGVRAVNYRVELVVSYKSGAPSNSIYAEVGSVVSDGGEHTETLTRLDSRICGKP